MKIIMRRDSVIFQNHGIGYAKGGTFLIKEFNQKIVLRQHRTIASSRFVGSFSPILRFEKFEIHAVFLHFSNLDLAKNLSPNLLVELCGVALTQSLIRQTIFLDFVF